MSDPVSLEKEFEVISKIKKELAEKTSAIDAEIERLQAIKLEIAAPYNAEIHEHTENIQTLILESKESFKCGFGKATFRKEYERASWDNKALMGYAAVHPEIEQFRKVTVVEASVSVSMGE